jgi:ketosteroid isomerase-like protein
MTRDLTRGYLDAWTHGDRDRVRDLLAPDALVEWNLEVPVDPETLLETLVRIAAQTEAVHVVSETYAERRAALVYDCVASSGTVRTAEFLAVSDGRIHEIRQVYDVAAVHRHLPGLLA